MEGSRFKVSVSENILHNKNYSRNELICTVFYSYVNYSNIAAKVVRKALKPELQADAAKRELVSIKFVKWENGKPVGKYFI